VFDNGTLSTDVVVTLAAFLGGSPWNSTGKPLLLVDPNCVFTAQLPGSDIQMDVYLQRVEGKAMAPATASILRRQEIYQTKPRRFFIIATR